MSESPRRTIRRIELVAQLRALGVPEGGVLLVHTSFRAVRPVEGGPAGLVAALREALGSGGTLVMPSWTGDDDTPFDARATRASPDLGVVADTFWRMPGVMRSAHGFACAAAGPRGERIVSGPLPLPPHTAGSPVGRVHDLDGHVLLLGVGHDANTSLHVAELLASVPYRVTRHLTIRGDDGRPRRIEYGENDHCCQGFAIADRWLRDRGQQCEGPVGHSHARLFRARDVVAAAVERLASEPTLFLHPRGECGECDEAWESMA